MSFNNHSLCVIVKSLFILLVLEEENLTAEDGMKIANQLQMLLNADVPIRMEAANMFVDIVNTLSSKVEDTIDPRTGSMITSFVNGMLEALVLNVSQLYVKDTETMLLEAVRLSVQEFQTNGVDFTAMDEELVDFPANFFSANQEDLQFAFTRYVDARLFYETGFKAIRDDERNLTLRELQTSNTSDEFVNSPVVAASIRNTTIQNAPEPVTITLPLLLTPMEEAFPNGSLKNYKLVDKKCVWWNYSANNETGGWWESGCSMTEGPNNTLLCKCNHLTSFAAIMRISVSVSDPILTILSIIGCSISIIGLLFTVITYSVFKTLRKNKSKKVLINFCVALCGVYITYLLGIATKLPRNQEQCIAAGFFLHYFMLAVIAWMFVEVLDMYFIFVKIWGTVNHHLLKAVVTGWFVPLLIALITFGVHFAVDKEDGIDNRIYPRYSEDAVCWLGMYGIVYAFIIPSSLVLITNLIIFTIVIYSITCKQTISKISHVQASKKRVTARRHIINAFALLLLVGPTWIVGYLVNINPGPDQVLNRIFSYIFVALNAFQGLWIFVMFSVRPKVVRRLWHDVFFKRHSLHSAISSPSESMSRGRHTHSTSAGGNGKTCASSPASSSSREGTKNSQSNPHAKTPVKGKVSWGSSHSGQSSTTSSSALLKATGGGTRARNIAAFHEKYVECYGRSSPSADVDKSREVQVTIESRDNKNIVAESDPEYVDAVNEDEKNSSGDTESRSSTPHSTSKILV